MAQTNFTPISLYYSATATNVPTAANLVAGELAINTADGKLFYKDSAGVVQTIASKDTNSGTFTNISVSGVASFADGTVSLPSITNIGDTNTGIFFPAADTIAFTEGGTESMRISSAGNLGIGQTSPSYKLDINKGSAGIIANFTDGVAQTLRILTDATTASIDSVSGTNLGFQVGSSEKMRIDSSGNVGIGTTTPTYKLSVAGPILALGAAGTDTVVNVSTTGIQNTFLGFNNSGSTNAYGVLNNNSYFGNGNTYGLQFISNGAVAATINTSGNMGIGTTSPDGKLKVVASGANLIIGFSGTQNYFDASENIFRNFAGSERMRIDSTGRLLVGTTSNVGS